LTINSGCTLSMSTFQMTGGGGFAASVSGTLNTLNIGTTPIPSGITWGGTVGYVSTASNQTVRSGTYNNLTIGGASGTRTFTAEGAITINGNLSYGISTATFADGGFTVSLAGNIAGAAGKHSGTGKIVMTGAGTTIAGSTNLGNIEFNNAAGFTLLGATTFNGTTTFTAGALTIGSNTMTIATGASMVGMSATNCLIGSAMSNISVTSTGSIGSLYFDQSNFGISNNIVTLTCSGLLGTTTIGNSLVVITLAMSGSTAVLADGGNTITVLGNITGTGRHSGTGKILMIGAGATISGMTQSGNIEMENPAGFSLSGNLSVNGTLKFTSGKLNIGSNTLIIATGGSFSGVSATNCLVGGPTSNLTISSTGTVPGVYLDMTTPGTTNNISTFTCSGAAGVTTLAADATVSTMLSLSANATLNDGGNTLTLLGDISGTGKHTGSGKILMTGTNKNISGLSGTGNIELDNGGNFNVTGNISCDGTLTFTSSTLTLGAITFSILTNGSVSGMSASKYFIGSAATNFTVNTTGNTGAIFFDQTLSGTSNNISIFTQTLGTTTLGSDLSVSTGLTLTAGTFNDNGKTVTVSGNLSGTAGAHTGTGKILMTGSGKTLSATTGGLTNVELNNAGGFSLSNTLIVNGALTFTSGKLSLGARLLTLKGTVAGMSAANCITGSTTSTLTVNTTGSLGTLYFDQTTPGTTNNIAIFTNATGNTTLGNAISMGALALTSGTLNDNGNVISLNGNITGTGTHMSGTGGKISLNAASKSVSGVTLGNLDLNYAGATTLTGNPTITGALTFLSTATFTITAGSRLTLNGTVAGMSTSNYFSGSTTSDLTIGSTGAVGTIYFGQTTSLNNIRNFVVNGGGSVVLGSNMTSVTSMDMSQGSGGSLGIGANTLFLNGTFAGGAGTGYLTGGASSILSVTAVGSYTLHLDQATPGTSNNIATFTKAGAGTVTLGTGSNLSAGTLALSAGTLTDGGNTITLNGNITGTGTHSGTGKIQMTGASAIISGATLGNLELNYPSGANVFSLSGSPTINGTLNFAGVDNTLNLASGTLTVKGAVNNMSATKYFTSNGTGSLTVNANGFTNTLFFDPTTPGTTNSLVAYTNADGTTLLGNELKTGTLTLTAGTLNDNGKLITLTGNIAGAGTHVSGTGGKISMIGLTKSISGATLGNVELNYPTASAFTLTGNPTINGDLAFTGTANTLTIGAHTINLNGTVTGMSATKFFLGSVASNIVVGSTGALGAIFMSQANAAARTLQTLTVSGGGSVTMGSISIVSTTLALTNGTLNDGGLVMTVGGNITGTGTHASTAGGKLTMNGAGKSISGATLGNVELSSASAFSLTGSPTVNGAFTFTSGTLNVGSNTLTLAGTVASMSGTKFITGGASSNLTITSTGALGSLFFDQSSAGTSNNFATFTMNGSGGSATLGNALSAGTLALTAGTLAGGANAISVTGDITGTGTHTSSGAGVITMTGANATISGATLGSLTLNNAFGFSLTGSPALNGTLTLTAGRLDLGSNNLALAGSAAVAGTPSASNMIVTSGSGQVRRSYSANGTYTFPVGDNSGNYTPLALNLTSGTYGGGAYVGVGVTNAKHPQNSNTNNYLNRYWTVNTSGITSPAYSLTATYVPADIVGTESGISGAKYTGSLPWVRFSTLSSNTVITPSVTNANVAITGISSSAPTVIASADATICNGGSTTVSVSSSTGSPVLNYTWAPATGLSATTGSSVTVSPTVTTTYTLTVTDGNDETATDEVVVTVTPAPSAAPANDGYICAGGTVNLTANFSGSTTAYSWAGANLSATTIANPSATPASTTTYTLTVTDGTANAGCSVDFTTTVNVHAVPTAAPSNNGYICNGGTVTLTANPADGAASYTWTGSNLSSGTAQNPTATPTASAVYTLSVSDGSGQSGCSPSTQYTTAVTVNETPRAAPTSSGSICVGGTVTLNANPASSATAYSWSGANLSSTTAQNPTATPTSTTVYTLTVSDGGHPGCAPATQYTISVTVDPVPTITSASSNGVACSGNALNLFANGPSNVTDYSWAGPNSFTSTNQNPSIPSVVPAAAGEYTVTVNNGTGDGCSATYTTTVTVTPGPVPITGTLSTCEANSTTLVNVTTGGSWLSSNSSVATIGSSTGSVFGVAAGNATMTYKIGATGCYVTAAVTVNVQPAAIGGVSNFCYGTTATLADAIPGGVWSTSNTTVAPIDAISGVVTGGNPGTATISYTMGAGTGCRATRTIAVNALPLPITGALAVCEGKTISLTDATTGGTWSSSDAAIATVGSSSGVVSGVLAGNAMITYTSGTTGCLRYVTATVNQSPAAITGNTPVCIGSTITLGNSISGGTWSSTAYATIGSATGILTGVVAGAPIISYTLSNGCNATNAGTVNTAPGAFGGVFVMCAGSSVNLSNNPGGGTWASSNAGIATVGSSGSVTGVSGGTALITYTLPAGCFKTKEVTVNAIAPITGGGSGVCVGTTLTLSDAVSGGAWSSSNTSRATVGPSTGVATGFAAGATNISYTMPSGCKVWIALAVNPISAITGTTMACVGLTTTLSNPTAGGSWSSSDLTVATVGSSNGVVLGVASDVATISYVMPTGCFSVTSVTINQAPSAITGPSTVCAGSVLTLGNAVSGGAWISSNTAVATVGSATGIVVGVSGGNTTITYSNGPGCSVTKVVTVSPILPITGTNSACIGMTTTLSDASAGGTWSSSDLAVATIGTSGVVSGLTQGISTITYALPSGCARAVAVSVNPVATSITGAGTVCASLTTTLSGNESGGTWSSSNGTIATVGSATGVVTGVASGTVNITYNMGLNCRISTIVTVNSSPAITGTAKACIGTSTTLSHSIPGGAWESANTSIATIGASDGIATGVASGTTTITYTPPSGCLRVVVVTINGLPGANSGVHTVCVGSTTLLTNATPGGVSFVSSTPSVATIGTSSGVVTGISAGTAIMTYNVNTSCYATSIVTVNAVPAAIAGSSSVCVASTIALNDATDGGTWTSSNVALATVGSTSGIVSGMSAGAPTITYTLNTGCYKVTTVTVLGNSANTGTPSVCVGTSATLSNATSGGVWSSGDGAIATVGGASGIVNGVLAGNANITYTNPAGCVRVSVATVNTTPAAITGTQSICVGFATALGNATTGGLWSGTNATVASIGTTGVVTGLASGTTNIRYTIGSCAATAMVTVNALPAPITGSTSVCKGANTTLADATPGGAWSSDITSVATLGTSGIVTGLAAGSVVVTYTAPTGCYRSVNVVVNPIPSAITGALHACPGTTTVVVDATGGGVSFTSSNTSVATVGATSGVVTGITVGTSTLTYTVNTGCYVTADVTINPIPAAITGASDVCPGLTLTLSDANPGGTWSSYYVVVGSTSGIVTGVGAGVHEVTYTLPTGCLTRTNVTVNPVADITGNSRGCVGAVMTLGSTVTSGTWSSNNTSVATIGSSTGVLTAVSNGTSTISYTTPAGCIVTREQTVNAVASSGAISGATTVLAGLQITLSNDIEGGAWASSNSSVATIEANTGIVTGVAGGNAVMSYTVNNGCGPVTGTYTVSVASSRYGNNIAANNAAVDFTVFPNPNKGEFTVKGVLAEAKDLDINVEVANVLGQVIYQQNMTAHNGIIEKKVILGNALSNGMYTLKLNLPGETKVFHFVLNQ
jgi:uncharacterized protein YjdB